MILALLTERCRLQLSKMKSFNELQQELNEIIEWFSSGDVDIDQAVERFKAAQELIDSLKQRIDSAELEINRIKKVD